ncbi:MAG TPA: SRPBCC domain-containing protein [Candidatus Saccharimonadales bacterium]|nr:SRPBCC domain-containing protein [Candidatus Saccharimonadales bacterium]
MNNQNYTATFMVDQSPEEVFKAVTNVRGWWGENVNGSTEKEGGEFVYEVPGVHRSVQKVTEVIPNKKVVWLVTESNMTFISDPKEWVGTRIVFTIAEENGKIKLTFVHEGLKPEVECYKFCKPAWDQYIKGSLYKLITTGEGTPNLEGKTIEKPAEV